MALEVLEWIEQCHEPCPDLPIFATKSNHPYAWGYAFVGSFLAQSMNGRRHKMHAQDGCDQHQPEKLEQVALPHIGKGEIREKNCQKILFFLLLMDKKDQCFDFFASAIMVSEMGSILSAFSR